jgi:hypothetical protein
MFILGGTIYYYTASDHVKNSHNSSIPYSHTATCYLSTTFPHPEQQPDPYLIALPESREFTYEPLFSLPSLSRSLTPSKDLIPTLR